MGMTSPVSRTERVDYSDLESVKRHADGIGPGTVVFKHPMRGVYSICHKARTDMYDMTWVVYEVRHKHEPKWVDRPYNPQIEERQSLDTGGGNERIKLRPNDYVD